MQVLVLAPAWGTQGPLVLLQSAASKTNTPPLDQPPPPEAGVQMGLLPAEHTQHTRTMTETKHTHETHTPPPRCWPGQRAVDEQTRSISVNTSPPAATSWRWTCSEVLATSALSSASVPASASASASTPSSSAAAAPIPAEANGGSEAAGDGAREWKRRWKCPSCDLSHE